MLGVEILVLTCWPDVRVRLECNPDARTIGERKDHEAERQNHRFDSRDSFLSRPFRASFRLDSLSSYATLKRGTAEALFGTSEVDR